MSNTKTIMGQASNQYVAPTDSSDLFSTFLYTGNGANQSIVNGIDLAGKGGMTWIKLRNSASNNELYDTERGATNSICSNTSDATIVRSTSLTSFNSNGFTLGAGTNVNANNYTVASWTFRKAPKFFDCVQYTGDGLDDRVLSHSLGSTPGMVIMKRTSSGTVAQGAWFTYHIGAGFSGGLSLNGTESAGYTYGSPITAASDTTVTINNPANNGNINASGETYVAYLFAHNNSDGGFGPNYDQDIIKCGSFPWGSSAGTEVNLGFEPQWILFKAANQAGKNWYIFDAMRGIVMGGLSGDGDAALVPNTSGAENVNTFGIDLTPTGFIAYGNNIASSGNIIYMAIRRGPLAPPEAGTEVFAIHDQAGSYTSPTNVGFPVDLSIMAKRTGTGSNSTVGDRLRGSTKFLSTSQTNAEDVGIDWQFDLQNNFQSTWTTGTISWMWKRAPSFFDAVAYTGTGSAMTLSHNLSAIPEMMWIKKRGASDDWAVYHSGIGNTKTLFLNATNASSTKIYWNNTTPTATQFYLGDHSKVSGANNYIAYLFSTLDGVSKVGSYTGTGGYVLADCGFTSGARFVLIKRTDAAGDWYLWDTTRGITSGNDPYLLLNSTAAEVTNTDYIAEDTSGFYVSFNAPAALNASGGSYIFYAVA